jgi:ribonuclease BN (tRNA processing enzyme)
VDLVVLGAGPAYTDRPGATGACYLLRSGGATLVLDLGQGSFPALAGEVDPAEVDGVVVSHLHPDHFIDLVALRHYLRYEFRPPRRVTVHAPRALPARLDALHDEPGFTSAVLDVEPLEAGRLQIGPFDLEVARVTHTDDSYGFRVSDGAGTGIVYSGDCGVAADLAALVRPGDTLLVEVSFGVGPVPKGALHLDAPAIVELATATRPGRILLTHIQMGFDREATVAAVRSGYPAPVELVEPGGRVASV